VFITCETGLLQLLLLLLPSGFCSRNAKVLHWEKNNVNSTKRI